MLKLPFQDADPAKTSFQFLEDLSTAYWFSEVLFAAIELGLFDCIQKDHPTTAELAGLSSCKTDELARLLTALERMELIKQTEEQHVCRGAENGVSVLRVQRPKTQSYAQSFAHVDSSAAVRAGALSSLHPTILSLSAALAHQPKSGVATSGEVRRKTRPGSGASTRA